MIYVALPALLDSSILILILIFFFFDLVLFMYILAGLLLDMDVAQAGLELTIALLPRPSKY